MFDEALMLTGYMICRTSLRSYYATFDLRVGELGVFTAHNHITPKSEL
jgi:hypothetical protein